jgi:hypothetical protein
MRNLKVLRDNWKSIRDEEALLLQTSTIQERLQQWAELQTAFEWQLQQTAPLFEADRREALGMLQSRLLRLGS